MVDASVHVPPLLRTLLRAPGGFFKLAQVTDPHLLSIANKEGAETASVVSTRIVGGSLGVARKVYLTELPDGTSASTYRPPPYTESIQPPLNLTALPCTRSQPFKSSAGARFNDRFTLRVALGTGTVHPTPDTLHPTPYTLHPTPYTLHPTP